MLEKYNISFWSLRLSHQNLTASIVTISTTAELSPTTNITTESPTPWPTYTPTQPSPLRIEIEIIATIGAALLVMKRR